MFIPIPTIKNFILFLKIISCKIPHTFFLSIKISFGNLILTLDFTFFDIIFFMIAIFSLVIFFKDSLLLISKKGT